MSMLRFMLLCLAVTLVLPWGSLHKLRMADAPGLVLAEAAQADSAAGLPANRLVAPHRCPGPALPGSPCAHWLAPVAGRDALPQAAPEAWPRPARALAANGRNMKPPLGPPRPA